MSYKFVKVGEAIAGGTTRGRGVWGDGSFIYVANGENGINVYSIDGDGVPTLEDTDDQGGDCDYLKIWGDGTWIFVAAEAGGLLVYERDINGDLTHKDTKILGSSYDVWGDGTYIYVASAGEGLVVYSVDGAGQLTLEGQEDHGVLYAAYSVWGDGTWVFVANGIEGLSVYSIAGDGTPTWISDNDPGVTMYRVWGDNNYIYAGDLQGHIYTFSVDVVGGLTIESTVVYTGTPAINGLWTHGGLAYAGVASGFGIYAFSVDGAGQLSSLCSYKPNGVPEDIWSDGTFVYMATSNYLNKQEILYVFNLVEFKKGSMKNIVFFPDGTIVIYLQDDGIPKTGLTVTLDVYNVTTALLALDGVTAGELGGGLYYYKFSAFDNDKIYAAIADGSATLGNFDRYPFGTSEALGKINKTKTDLDNMYLNLRDWMRKI